MASGPFLNLLVFSLIGPAIVFVGLFWIGKILEDKEGKNLNVLLRGLLGHDMLFFPGVITFFGIVITIGSGVLSIALLFLVTLPALFFSLGEKIKRTEKKGFFLEVERGKKGDQRRRERRRKETPQERNQRLLEELKPSCPSCGGETQYSEEERDFYCWNCEGYISQM